ncbi:hypothetical protein GJ496_000027, partial [Pomphorhynchus laevis]
LPLKKTNVSIDSLSRRRPSAIRSSSLLADTKIKNLLVKRSKLVKEEPVEHVRRLSTRTALHRLSTTHINAKKSPEKRIKSVSSDNLKGVNTSVSTPRGTYKVTQKVKVKAISPILVKDLPTMKRIESCGFCKANFSNNSDAKEVASHILDCCKDKLTAKMIKCPFCSLPFKQPRWSYHKIRCHVQACAKKVYGKPFRIRPVSAPTDQRRKLKPLQRHGALPLINRSLGTAVNACPPITRRLLVKPPPTLISPRSEGMLKVSKNEIFAKRTRPRMNVSTKTYDTRGDRVQTNRTHCSVGAITKEKVSRSTADPVAIVLNDDSSNVERASSSIRKSERINNLVTKLDELNYKRRFSATVENLEANNEVVKVTPATVSTKTKLKLLARRPITSVLSHSLEETLKNDNSIVAIANDVEQPTVIENAISNNAITHCIVKPNQPNTSPIIDIDAEQQIPQNDNTNPTGVCFNGSKELNDCMTNRYKALEALAKGMSLEEVTLQFHLPINVVQRDFYGDFSIISDKAVILGRIDLVCCDIEEGCRASLASLKYKLPYKYLLMILRGKSQEYTVNQFYNDFDQWKEKNLKRPRSTSSSDSTINEQNATKRQRLRACLIQHVVPSKLHSAINYQISKPITSTERSSKSSLESTTLKFNVPTDINNINPIKTEQRIHLSRVSPKSTTSHPVFLISDDDHPNEPHIAPSLHSPQLSAILHTPSPHTTILNKILPALRPSESDEQRIVNTIINMDNKMTAAQHAIFTAQSAMQKPSNIGREWWHYILFKYPDLRKSLVGFYKQKQFQQQQQNAGTNSFSNNQHRSNSCSTQLQKSNGTLGINTANNNIIDSVNDSKTSLKKLSQDISGDWKINSSVTSQRSPSMSSLMFNHSADEVRLQSDSHQYQRPNNHDVNNDINHDVVLRHKSVLLSRNNSTLPRLDPTSMFDVNSSSLLVRKSERIAKRKND